MEDKGSGLRDGEWGGGGGGQRTVWGQEVESDPFLGKTVAEEKAILQYWSEPTSVKFWTKGYNKSEHWSSPYIETTDVL